MHRQMEEATLRIQRFEEIPSADEFYTRIEPRNVPTVFAGCITSWKAFSKWNPFNGGLDYLQARAGPSVVEAMLSRSAPVFNGDIRSHERVPLPFSTFIRYCKQLLQSHYDGHGNLAEAKEQGLERSGMDQDHLPHGEAPEQIYLAQVPIMNIENEERVQLECLREDILTPSFLEIKTFASINLWMNGAQTRSSTHYDPHHNLLCVVTGCKRVVLWPPSASPFLYPLPLYGEASNHSAVSLEKPDLSVHPRARSLGEYSQELTLHAGDALFIPEGWFHQVDSDDLTIAVNFWWRSEIISGMSEHMDAYYLRRILKRLTDREMDKLLYKISAGVGKVIANASSNTHDQRLGNGGLLVDLNNESKGAGINKQKQTIKLHELDPLALQSLYGLISLVHDRVSIADQSQLLSCTSSNAAVRENGENFEGKKTTKVGSFNLEHDPVAAIFWNLQPLTLQNVFLAMAQNFPRTLEALMLHLLSPVGAEILTRRFDEMDQLTAEEDRNEFYRIFYSVFDNQFAAMDALLNGKESFALQAFRNVLNQYLGINLDNQGS